jgi:hypothetical protein
MLPCTLCCPPSGPPQHAQCSSSSLLLLSTPTHPHTHTHTQHTHTHTHPWQPHVCAEYLDGLLAPAGLADASANAVLGHGLSFLVGRASYAHALQVGGGAHVLRG